MWVVNIGIFGSCARNEQTETVTYAFIGTMFRYLKYTVINTKSVALSNDKLLEIDMITQYIKEHFRENLKVDFETIKSLVNFFRTQYSKELLQNTNASIQYIATENYFVILLAKGLEHFRIWSNVSYGSEVLLKSVDYVRPN
jgi:hypothetical protein